MSVMMTTERAGKAITEGQVRGGVRQWTMGGEWREGEMRSPPRDLDFDELFADTPDTLSSSPDSNEPQTPKSGDNISEREVNGHGEWAVEPLTSEQRRIEANRERARRLRANQSPDTRLRNLERNRERARQRRALLSPSSKESKLEIDRERARQRRADLSPSTKRRMLDQNRERARRRRANQSPSARQKQLDRGRERARHRRAHQSSTARQRQLDQARERAKQRRGTLSPEDRQLRLERDRERARRRRAANSPNAKQEQHEVGSGDQGDSVSPTVEQEVLERDVDQAMEQDVDRVLEQTAAHTADHKQPLLGRGETPREPVVSGLPVLNLSELQHDQYIPEQKKESVHMGQYLQPLIHRDERSRRENGHSAGGTSPWIHIRTEL